jgi:ribosomal protein L14
MLVESGPYRAVVDTGFAVVKHDDEMAAIKNGDSIRQVCTRQHGRMHKKKGTGVPLQPAYYHL